MNKEELEKEIEFLHNVQLWDIPTVKQQQQLAQYEAEYAEIIKNEITDARS